MKLAAEIKARRNDKAPLMAVHRGIESMYRRARLTEHDIDLATSGLCGTFALALYRDLTRRGIDAQLDFICLRQKNGSPAYIPGYEGEIAHIRWRHAVVKVAGIYYDVEGSLELADAFQNYCWEHWVEGGIEALVTPSDFAKVLRGTRSSYDGRYYVKWKRNLSAIRINSKKLCFAHDAA